MKTWTPGTWVGLAAISGFMAVAFGAFAAHGLDGWKAIEWAKTGAQYQMTHALAVFAAFALHRAGAKHMGIAVALFLAGSVVFSGTLYAMALGGPRILGAITPIGGVAFLAGWGLMAFRGFEIKA